MDQLMYKHYASLMESILGFHIAYPWEPSWTIFMQFFTYASKQSKIKEIWVNTMLHMAEFRGEKREKID